jgi:hypothetical protein
MVNLAADKGAQAMTSLPDPAKTLFPEMGNINNNKMMRSAFRNGCKATGRLNEENLESNNILLPFSPISDARFKPCFTNYYVKYKKQKIRVQIGWGYYLKLCKVPLKCRKPACECFFMRR